MQGTTKTAERLFSPLLLSQTQNSLKGNHWDPMSLICADEWDKVAYPLCYPATLKQDVQPQRSDIGNPPMLRILQSFGKQKRNGIFNIM